MTNCDRCCRTKCPPEHKMRLQLQGKVCFGLYWKTLEEYAWPIILDASESLTMNREIMIDLEQEFYYHNPEPKWWP